MAESGPTAGNPDREAVQTTRPAWFPVAIIAVLGLCAVAIHQRDRIRAHWWAMQLAKTDDLDRRAYYLASLAAVGDSAAGAIRELARSENPDVRLLAVTLLARLPETRSLRELQRLVTRDGDRDVRESAALALAFSDTTAALGVLCNVSMSRSRGAAAAAVASLARMSSPQARRSLCRVLAEHSDPFVRAQAAESLIEGLMAEPGKPPTSSAEFSQERPALAGGYLTHRGDCDPIDALVAALSDQATFSGRLALERQIATVEHFVRGHIGHASPGAPELSAAIPTRTVAEIAAGGLEMLTGRPVDPVAARTPQQRAQLARQCRLWIAEQRATSRP